MLYNVHDTGSDSIGLVIVTDKPIIALDVCTSILGHLIKSAKCDSQTITGANYIEYQSATIT
jgi:hypothetical protein